VVFEVIALGAAGVLIDHQVINPVAADHLDEPAWPVVAVGADIGAAAGGALQSWSPVLLCLLR
jgi:hypothetical protein